MSIHHHPDDATLLSFAAGSLSDSFEILVSCHLQNCPSCRQRIAEAEAIGAAMVSAITPQSVNRRDEFLQLLDQEEDKVSYLDPHLDERSTQVNTPTELEKFLQQGDINLPWKKLVPGIEQIKLDTLSGGLKLLKIAPDTAIPTHSHKGSELTLILSGSYMDELGCFARGDVADLDPTVEHQPRTSKDEACICLVATDAPLKFRGLVPRLVQPFIDF